MTLTPVEDKVLAYIYSYELDNGRVPSLAQIAEDKGFSRSKAQRIINELVKNNKLMRVKYVQTSGYKLP